MDDLESKKLEKAREIVTSRSVKLHKFRPSGRKIYTVVGRESEELVEPEVHLCSCANFLYRVLNEREKTCYHLAACVMAIEKDMLDVIELGDDEYTIFITMLLKDILSSHRDIKIEGIASYSLNEV